MSDTPADETGKTQGLNIMSFSHLAHTLLEDFTSFTKDQIDIEDWSQTGRGYHIDFGDEESIPIAQGRSLGRGSVGDVYETTIRGHKVAHKKILFRRRIRMEERKEIQILKRLSHIHVVQLIGTYTQRRQLGILMYPVAVCDMHTFFEDVEAWSKAVEKNSATENRRKPLSSEVEARLHALEYDFPQGGERNWASLVYFKIGCLISAITYLHEQKIRHKDLKPSNILLSPGQLWLSDFGSATDFTLLSQSATDNERGTPRYFAPEVAEWKPNGRAADMFSLGCVLLEILSLHRRGSLSILREHRGRDPAYHANVNHLSTWLKVDDTHFSRREHYLQSEINLMLSADPKRRPKAKELLHGIAAHDVYLKEESTSSMFGDCCARTSVHKSQLEKMVEDKNRLVDQLVKKGSEAIRARIQSKLESQRHEDEMSRHQAAFVEKSSQLDETEAILRNVSEDRVEKWRLCSQLEERLSDSQTAYFNLKDEVLHLKAQITASRDRDNLAGRTSFAEDTISFDTVPKRRRDKSRHSLNVEEEHDKYIGQIPNIPHVHVRDFDSEKDQRIDQSSKTQNYYVSGRPSPCLTDSRSTYDDLAPGAFRETELHRSASSQANIPVVPQSDRYVRPESFDTKMERSTKPKLGFLEALAHGVKVGGPAAKEAAKLAYGREWSSFQVPYEQAKTTEYGTDSSEKRSR